MGSPKSILVKIPSWKWIDDEFYVIHLLHGNQLHGLPEKNTFTLITLLTKPA